MSDEERKKLFMAKIKQLDRIWYRWMIIALVNIPVPWSLSRRNIFYDIACWQYGNAHLLQSWKWEQE